MLSFFENLQKNKKIVDSIEGPYPSTVRGWLEFFANEQIRENDELKIAILRKAYKNGLPEGIAKDIKTLDVNYYLSSDYYFDYNNWGTRDMDHLRYLFLAAFKYKFIDKNDSNSLPKKFKLRSVYSRIRNSNGLWYNIDKISAFLKDNYAKEDLAKMLQKKLSLPNKKIQRFSERFEDFKSVEEDEEKLKNAIKLALGKEDTIPKTNANIVESIDKEIKIEARTNFSDGNKEEPKQNTNSALSENNTILTEEIAENEVDKQFIENAEEQVISYEEIELSGASKVKQRREKVIRTSIDHEEINSTIKESGDKGEDIVLRYEKDRHRHNGATEEELNKIIKVSELSDDFGFDIMSFGDDGDPIFIEVKSTKKQVGNIDFFYTENELQTAKKLGDRYKIYLVFDVHSSNPVIKNIGNPIITGKVNVRPITYSVSVNLNDI